MKGKKMNKQKLDALKIGSYHMSFELLIATLFFITLGGQLTLLKKSLFDATIKDGMEYEWS